MTTDTNTANGRLTLADLRAATEAPKVDAPAPTFRRGNAGASPAASTPRPATDKAKGFLRSLLAERAGSPEAEAIRARLNEARTSGTLDARTVSAAIDDLKALPRVAAPATSATPAATAVRGGAWTEVPDGYFAVESLSGNNDLDFYMVSTDDTGGEWNGFRRVEMVVGGKADLMVKGPRRRTVLEAILNATYEAPERTITLDDGTTGVLPARSATGPEAAGLRYADEIGRCTRCNRTLTDLTSRLNGIGPVCITKD